MRALRGLLGLLAPPHCAGCAIALPLGGLFCPGCELLLDRPPAAQRPPQHASAAFVFGGPLAEAVRSFKYRGRSDLAAPLGRMLARAALPFAGRVDVVIPIPLHPERLRERGFNQSALLARPLSRALGTGLDVRSLARVRPTRVQAGLSRSERLDNVEGAFGMRRGPRGAQRVLLVDDVRTTGATLSAAARCLQDAGFADVYTLALARAEA